jgi:dolichol-phosphate mannosyltransferase
MRGTTVPAPDAPVVSVVLATLNERRNLPEVLDRIRRLPLGPTEVIVVDDGSTDGTRELVTERARSDPWLRLLKHEGKQTTLRAQGQGIAEAHAPYVVVMDADLQHPPEAIPAMLESLESGASLVVASRYAAGGTAGPRTVPRLLISRGAEWTAKALLPGARRVSDPVSGFFAFRRDVWVPLNPNYRGYKLLLFLLAMVQGRRVSEVPFRFEPRSEGASKVVQGPAFVRFFLVEVLLARRLSSALARSEGSGPPLPRPAR